MAASLTLDRGHGKAPQVIEDERYDLMTDHQLDERVCHVGRLAERRRPS
jgi:hypothetical protein